MALYLSKDNNQNNKTGICPRRIKKLDNWNWIEKTTYRTPIGNSLSNDSAAEEIQIMDMNLRA